jgi:hypothetical protein
MSPFFPLVLCEAHRPQMEPHLRLPEPIKQSGKLIQAGSAQVFQEEEPPTKMPDHSWGGRSVAQG